MDEPSMEDMNIVSDSDEVEDREDQEYLAIKDEDEDVPKEMSRNIPPEDPPAAEAWSEKDFEESTGQPIGLQPPSDPRRRPPNEDFASWEPPQGPSGM